MNEYRDYVQGATMLPKIDLKSSYDLIRIKEGDQ